jgi:hypothetical protein
MIQGFFAFAGRIDEDFELRTCFTLTDVFIELLWPKGTLKYGFGLPSPGADHSLITTISI